MADTTRIEYRPPSHEEVLRSYQHQEAVEAAFRDFIAEAVAEVAEQAPWLAKLGDGNGGYLAKILYDELLAVRLIQPPLDRQAIYKRDGRVCAACGATTYLCIDHKIPISRGGTNDPENLQVLCVPCNSSKGSKIPEEWAGRKAIR